MFLRWFELNLFGQYHQEYQKEISEESSFWTRLMYPCQATISAS